MDAPTTPAAPEQRPARRRPRLPRLTPRRLVLALLAAPVLGVVLLIWSATDAGPSGIQARADAREEVRILEEQTGVASARVRSAHWDLETGTTTEVTATLADDATVAQIEDLLRSTAARTNAARTSGGYRLFLDGTVQGTAVDLEIDDFEADGITRLVDGSLTLLGIAESLGADPATSTPTSASTTPSPTSSSTPPSRTPPWSRGSTASS